MEYPFKDLLPLDEVLAREGYYKDWTHLDPEVFYSLTQISNFIKTKGYGVDVRLLIAQLAEHFGLKTTQVVDLANLLQQKFTNLEGITQSFTNNINSLVAQMEAEKDAVIANATVDSEVILARGGKPTLQARLDETTAQLAQTQQQKANISYVDTKVNAMANGTPKIVVQSVSNLPGTVGDEKLALVLDSGHKYYHNGSSWVDAGVYQAVEVANRSIGLEKTTITKVVSRNLFNKNTAKQGYSISATTGQERDTTGFWVSDFIPIEPLETYIKLANFDYAYYTIDKVFISGDSSNLMVAPENAGWLRVSFSDAPITNNTARVNKGTTLLPYEPYREIIEKSYTEKHPIEVDDVPPLPIEKLSFIEESTNLFDKAKAKTGFYLRGDIGRELEGEGFAVSDYIRVDENVAFIIKAIRHISYYSDKSEYDFIDGVSGETQWNFSDVTPQGTKYLRFSWYLPGDGVSLGDQQMNLGNVLLPYEKSGGIIPKEYLDVPNNSGQDLEIKSILPETIYAVVGHEINIYFENILNVPQKDVFIDVACEIGKHEEKRWTTTPEEVGTYPITISVYKDYELVNQVVSSIVVSGSGVGGDNRNALIIGDSTINNQYMLNSLVDKIETDNLELTLYGTRGSGSVRHEGRGGWTASDYRSDKEYSNPVSPNPFYNSAVQDFDFNFYMENQSYPTLDYVGICLGINDTFHFNSDETVLNEIPNILGNLDHMINSIKTYNPDIKVGVFVTIPPNTSQDAFAEAYGNGQTQWRYKRNNAIWIDELVKHYDKRKTEGIYLVPDNNNIDTKTGFRDGVHPNAEIGDKQRGETLYYWLKSFEV